MAKKNGSGGKKRTGREAGRNRRSWCKVWVKKKGERKRKRRGAEKCESWK
jgi:hypothetical protein